MPHVHVFLLDGTKFAPRRPWQALTRYSMYLFGQRGSAEEGLQITLVPLLNGPRQAHPEAAFGICLCVVPNERSTGVTSRSPKSAKPPTIWATHRIKLVACSSTSGIRVPPARSSEPRGVSSANMYPIPILRLYGVRPDVTNLAEWDRIPGLSTTVYLHDRLKLDWHLNVRGMSLDSELTGGAGYLTLTPSASHRPPDLRGLHVTTTSQLELELFHGWSLAEIAVRVLHPLADLMTPLSGKPCVIRLVCV